MSKIEELIEQYCSEGVKFVILSEICDIKTGKGITRNDAIDGGKYPIISGGKEPMGYYNTFNRKGNCVTISRVGANAGFVNYIDVDFYLNDKCFSILFKGGDDIPKYLFFYLKSIEPKIIDLQSEGGVPTINTAKVGNILIPIPPLSVQEEIVNILDKFIALEAELEAELEVRRHQYEYYRNELLDFEGKDVEWKTLGEIGYYSKDRISANEICSDTYVGVDNLLQNKKGKTFSSYVPTSGNLTQFILEDILIGNIRPYLKKIWKSDITGGTNGDVLVIRINNDYKAKLISAYLYYLLSSDHFFDYNMQYAKGAKMPRGDKESILKYSIPIPPLEEQERIVTILDKFNALVNDISVGLPAEIAARRQQYEYYRGKLLTFEPLAVAQ